MQCKNNLIVYFNNIEQISILILNELWQEVEENSNKCVSAIVWNPPVHVKREEMLASASGSNRWHVPGNLNNSQYDIKNMSIGIYILNEFNVI